MKINFEEAKLLMGFMDRLWDLYKFERPLVYQYVSNFKTVDLSFIADQVLTKPHVYERAINYLKSIITEEELALAAERYAKFESLFEQKKRELKENIFEV